MGSPFNKGNISDYQSDKKLIGFKGILNLKKALNSREQKNFTLVGLGGVGGITEDNSFNSNNILLCEHDNIITS